MTYASQIAVQGTSSASEVLFSQHMPFSLMAGPCVIESEAHALEVSAALKEVCAKAGVGLVYKSSFDKANRTSIGNGRGVGMKKGLEILANVKQTHDLPIITDVHEPEQCAPVAEVSDILQIPAMLCRQTDLLVAAGETGRPLNVKKGQFMAPWDMAHAAGKVASTGNNKVMLCERGTSFGYNTLVNDMRGLIQMADIGCPIIFDATHSVQKPAAAGGKTGGDRRFVAPLARAALAVGAAGVFMEVHPDPDKAPSDGPNMLHLKDLPEVLGVLTQVDRIAKAHPVPQEKAA